MKKNKIQRIDIKIGFRCNNHCKFCIQGNEYPEIFGWEEFKPVN